TVHFSKSWSINNNGRIALFGCWQDTLPPKQAELMETFGCTKPNNQAVLEFVREIAEETQPDQIFWVDGSEAEKQFLIEEALAQGVFLKLNQEKLPGC